MAAMLKGSSPTAHILTLLTIALIGLAIQHLQPFWNRPQVKQASSNYTCEPVPYISRVVSYDPLIIHLENFVTAGERRYLADRSEPLQQRSLVVSRDGSVSVKTSGRTSSTALIPYDDPVSACIRQRAADFQGFLPVEKIEKAQVVRYLQHQEYRAHFDWGVGSEVKRERLTTIFGIIDADCENCGTQFPDISVDWSKEDPRWCKFVECENQDALTFKAVPGSAVFWKNLHDDGTGDERVVHAGLPVKEGKKIGLNIWTEI